MVTGGAGYIGSHACKMLASKGFTPICYDNLVYGHEWAVQWGPLEIGDIMDRDRLNEVLDKYSPAAVMHFSAFAYVGESVSEPSKYYRNNIIGTLVLLEAMKEYGIEKFIFSSSCATYGIPETVPITEAEKQKPINPYGHTKLMVEQILRDYDLAYGLRSISLRYFNAAGADADAEIGELHEPETHLIPLIIEAAQGKRSNVEIYGTDYPTPDGTAVRDYIHVNDLADAHILALTKLLEGGDSCQMNLGVGHGHSVKQVIEAVEKVSKKSVPVNEVARRPGDPPVLVADARFAREQLGWTPKYVDIEAIVETAWNWHQKTV